MGLFSKDKKLKFKLIPSTPEQTQARSYLTGLMDQDIQFPTEQIAPLTGTEQQIQEGLPSYLNQIAEDFETSRGYYNDVLSGGYDPATSDFYQGFRAEQDRMKRDALLGIARQGQMAGMSRSTPVLGVQARTGAAIDDATLRQLGLLYENERDRRTQAAGSLSQLGSQHIGNLSYAEQLAAVQRQNEQAKLSAMYQAVLQTLLAPYQYNAQIAGALLDSRDGLVGRRLAVPVARGTPLSGAVLVPRTALEGLPSGTVAVHVGASDPRMLDLLSPGQTVRLHRVDSGLLAASGVRVLAVDPAGEAMADRGAARGLVVALTPQAADEALAGDGTFDTALRFHVLPEAS